MFPLPRIALAALMLSVTTQALAQVPPAPRSGERDHRITGAPSPTPGPARTGLSKNPQQWEIQTIAGIKPEESYSIYSLRRAELNLSSELTFKENNTRDKTGWGMNGGDFVFKRDTASTNVRDHRVVRESEFLAIYYTKTRRYLRANGLWADSPQYISMARKIAEMPSGARPSVRFALFNTERRKWLMVCQREPLSTANKEMLCLYDMSGG